MKVNTRSICVATGFVSSFIIGIISGSVVTRLCICRRNRRLLCDGSSLQDGKEYKSESPVENPD